MIPVTFPEVNIVYAKDQPEYQPLPALRDERGKVISCWKMSWKERIKLLFTGRVYISVLTFGGSLQPMLPSLDLEELKAPLTF